jgi:hypothetical protein
MRATLIVILVVLLVAVLATQIGAMVKAKDALTQRVEYHLDSVREDNAAAVKADIARDAANIGIVLVPDNILIACEDTQQRTLPQKIVGDKIGAQFVNKRVSIIVRYEASVLGIPVARQIAKSKIRQVQALRPEPTPSEVE